MTYKVLRAIMQFIMLFIFRIKVTGKENMLSEGGAIVAINHRSNWDVVVSGLYSPRRLGFMAKSELFKNKLLARLFKNLGAFPVHRGKGDIGAIKTALRRLHDGELIAIFPEGTRVKNNEIVPAKHGAVLIAQRAQVPIIPINISGGYRWLSKVTMNIGKPVLYEEYYGEKLTVEQLQELSDNLMNTIRALDSEKVKMLKEEKI